MMKDLYRDRRTEPWGKKFAFIPRKLTSGRYVWLRSYYERKVVSIMYFPSGSGDLWGDVLCDTFNERKKDIFEMIKDSKYEIYD